MADEDKLTHAPPRRAWLRNALLVTIAVLAIGALVWQAYEDKRRADLVASGMPAPAFSMERLEGGQVELEALRGKVVLLDFWATWCPPCREEMPHFVALAKEYESQGLVFIAATRDERAIEETVRRYAIGVVPGLLPYVAWADDRVSADYQIDSLPTLYFIDRQGQIGEAITGYQSEAVLRRRIEDALK